jgi:ureidoglycolate hydrolase
VAQPLVALPAEAVFNLSVIEMERPIMNVRPAFQIQIQRLEAAAFAPFGEIIAPRRSGGQFANNPYDPETSPEEPKLVLTNGTPRLWIMHLNNRGVVFKSMARHRRTSQCLGSLQGKEWLVGVAPPNDFADGVKPEFDRISAFLIPGDCVIKLHVGTWHAGPHFTHDECLFLNLENLDTNKKDFDTADLPTEVEMVS